MKSLKLLAASAAGAAACALAVQPASAEEAVGKWTGQLPEPVGLHLVLIIEKDARGNYSGVLRSPDQGPDDIPATAVEAAPDHLKFTVDRLGIAYDGHWDETREAWVGDFRQSGREMALDLRRSDGPDPQPDRAWRSPVLAPIEGLDGAWAGDLDAGAHKLRIILHVFHVNEGTKASFDSPDQGAIGLPVTSLERHGDNVSFGLEALGVSYKGTLSAAAKSINGILTRNGRELKLDLRKEEAATEPKPPRRPQEEAIAATPIPYRSETAAFYNPAAPGVKLAGTLTLPKGQGSVPAVVLISGSGPNTRDEDLAGHKVFLVLADYLTRHGLAVLRYDKRGVGKSTGNYSAATSDDFASDTEAAIAYLRSRPEIDGSKLGVIGHSEGGLIAPLVAVKDPSLAFIVMMAGPGVPGRILLAKQRQLIARATGFSPQESDAIYARLRRVFDGIANSNDAAEGQARARAIEESADPKPSKAEIDLIAATAASPWLRRFLAYDPVPTLQKVRVPALVLNGALDLQVPSSLNLPPIRRAMKNDPDLTVIELSGLNHLFQHATTGSPVEYESIEETLAPELLDTVSAWIARRVQRSRALSARPRG
jgi:hypothetical protein